MILRILFRSIFFTERGGFKNSAAHVLKISGFAFAYFPLWVINHLFLLLDEIVFFKYRKVQVNRPVFIIGVPRSGTTFLFRTLAKDVDHFSCFKLWEILFALSICQKLFFIFIWKLDRFIGHPFKKISLYLSSKSTKKIAHIHPSRLDLPEEDELLLLHIFSTPFLHYLFPQEALISRFIHFDRDVAKPKKQKVMLFYKRCVQRHIYVFGKNKTFLSKNPAFIGKIESIRSFFPDAHFVVLQRNPQDTIPSFVSLCSSFYRLSFSFFQNPLAQKNAQDVLSWYQSIYQNFKTHNSSHSILNYSQLITNISLLIPQLYSHLHLALNPEFIKVVIDLEKQQLKRKSNHHYANEKLLVSQIPEMDTIPLLPPSFQL